MGRGHREARREALGQVGPVDPGLVAPGQPGRRHLVQVRGDVREGGAPGPRLHHLHEEGERRRPTVVARRAPHPEAPCRRQSLEVVLGDRHFTAEHLRPADPQVLRHHGRELLVPDIGRAEQRARAVRHLWDVHGPMVKSLHDPGQGSGHTAAAPERHASHDGGHRPLTRQQRSRGPGSARRDEAGRSAGDDIGVAGTDAAGGCGVAPRDDEVGVGVAVAVTDDGDDAGLVAGRPVRGCGEPPRRRLVGSPRRTLMRLDATWGACPGSSRHLVAARRALDAAEAGWRGA